MAEAEIANGNTTIIGATPRLDHAYPPFISGAIAAGMSIDVTVFCAFYGLSQLTTQDETSCNFFIERCA